jgi:hypothetical protein
MPLADFEEPLALTEFVECLFLVTVIAPLRFSRSIAPRACEGYGMSDSVVDPQNVNFLSDGGSPIQLEIGDETAFIGIGIAMREETVPTKSWTAGRRIGERKALTHRVRAENCLQQRKNASS